MPLLLHWSLVQSIHFSLLLLPCPVSWNCRIHWLLLSRGCKTTHHNECPAYDTKQSDGNVPIMLHLWGMWSTLSLLSLPGPLWPEMVAPDRVLSMVQIKLNSVLMLNWIAWNIAVFTFKLHTYAKLNCLKWIYFCMLDWIVRNRTVWHLIVCKQKTILILNWIVWNRTVWLNWIAWNRNVFDN